MNKPDSFIFRESGIFILSNIKYQILLFMELNGFSIENWCIELDKAPKDRKLSKDDAKYLISIAINADKIDESDEVRNHLLKGKSLASVMLNRVEGIHTYSITNSALLYIDLMVNTPGECTMLSNYLQYLSKRDKISKFDLTKLTRVFESGFWSKDVLESFWDSQKLYGKDRIGPSDNMLDYPFRFGMSLGLVK